MIGLDIRIMGATDDTDHRKNQLRETTRSLRKCTTCIRQLHQEAAFTLGQIGGDLHA